MMTTNQQLIFEQYTTLEDEFLKILKYIPFEENHYNVWSFEIGNLLLNVGSLIDSFFKNSLNSPTFDTVDQIENYRDRDQPTMKIFREVYKSRYKIENKRIFELRNFTAIQPYKKWGDNLSLDWWKNYTAIKHDRLRNKEKSTLKTTLDALGGLFLLTIIHVDTIPIFVDYDVIKSGGYTKSYLTSLLTKGEPVVEFGGMPYYAKTKLFGYIYEIEGSAFDDPSCRRILSPSYPGYGW